jgi:hypothetical protein
MDATPRGTTGPALHHRQARVSLLAHAAPGRWKNDGFYDLLSSSWREQEWKHLRVVLIHRNDLRKQQDSNVDYDSIPNLDVVIAEGT